MTIDWSVPQVEVDAKVVLREGPLELLLCATGTKEHESILATDADVTKIYEALGMIGLEPGHPAAYDPQTQQATAATGQRVAIDLVTPVGEGKRTTPAHEWMQLAEGKTTMPAPRWVFCGSARNDAGRLTAAVEGTIVCVVDFDTALIAIGESHTASNDALWLAADPAMVPELGTACTVIFRPLSDEPLTITLTPENFFRLGDRVLDALELDALIRDRIRHNPEQKVLLKESGSEPNPFARLAAHAIVGSGIKRENLALDLLPPATPPAPSAAPAPANASPADEPAPSEAPAAPEASPAPAEAPQ